MRDFASIWVILMLIKIGTYSKDLKDQERLKGPKRPKPASLKCERLGFRALSPTRKPKSLARPVPTLFPKLYIFSKWIKLPPQFECLRAALLLA